MEHSASRSVEIDELTGVLAQYEADPALVRRQPATRQCMPRMNLAGSPLLRVSIFKL